jgi:hypothetical protein
VPNRDRPWLAGQHKVVVGGGPSAADTLLELAELREREPDTRISWAIRDADPASVYGGEDKDGMPARAALGSRLRRLVETGAIDVHTSMRITELNGDDGVNVTAATDEDPVKFHADRVVPPEGARMLSPPEKEFFIAGMKSYGRARTFPILTGYEQIRSIVAALAGDQDAADRIELVLPETGVCSAGVGSLCDSPSQEDGAESAGCCGPAEPVVIGMPTGLRHGCSGQNEAK